MEVSSAAKLFVMDNLNYQVSAAGDGVCGAIFEAAPPAAPAVATTVDASEASSAAAVGRRRGGGSGSAAVAYTVVAAVTAAALLQWRSSRWYGAAACRWDGTLRE